MHLPVQSFFDTRGRLLLAGRLDEVLDSFCYPFLFDRPGGRIVVARPADHLPALQKYLAELRGRRAYALTAEIRLVELPRNGRMRVCLRWHEQPAGLISDVTYFLDVTGSAPKIAMMDYSVMDEPVSQAS